MSRFNRLSFFVLLGVATVCLLGRHRAEALPGTAQQPYLSVSLGGSRRRSAAAEHTAKEYGLLDQPADASLPAHKVLVVHPRPELMDTHGAGATFFGDHGWNTSDRAGIPRMWMAGFGWWPPLTYGISTARSKFESLDESGARNVLNLDDHLLAAFGATCGPAANHLPQYCAAQLPRNYSASAALANPFRLERRRRRRRREQQPRAARDNGESASQSATLGLSTPTSSRSASSPSPSSSAAAAASTSFAVWETRVAKLLGSVVAAIEQSTLEGQRPRHEDVGPAVAALVEVLRAKKEAETATRRGGGGWAAFGKSNLGSTAAGDALLFLSVNDSLAKRGGLGGGVSQDPQSRLATVRVLVSVAVGKGDEGREATSITTTTTTLRVPVFTFLYQLLGDADFQAAASANSAREYTRLEVFDSIVKAFSARPPQSGKSDTTVPRAESETDDDVEGGFGVDPISGISLLWLLLEQQHSVGLVEELLDKGVNSAPVHQARHPLGLPERAVPSTTTTEEAVDVEVLPTGAAATGAGPASSNDAADDGGGFERTPVAMAFYKAHLRQAAGARTGTADNDDDDDINNDVDPLPSARTTTMRSQPGISLLHVANTCHVVSTLAKTLLYVASMVERDPAMPMPAHLASMIEEGEAFTRHLPTPWRLYLAGVAESFGFDHLPPRPELDHGAGKLLQTLASATSSKASFPSSSLTRAYSTSAGSRRLVGSGDGSANWLAALTKFLRSTLKSTTRDISFWEAQALYNQVHGRLVRLLLNGPSPPSQLSSSSSSLPPPPPPPASRSMEEPASHVEEVALADSLGNTPLHFAASGGDLVLFHESLRKGILHAAAAAAAAAPSSKQAPTASAISNGDNSLCPALAAFANGYLTRNIDGRTPLHVAAVMWGYEAQFVHALHPEPLLQAVLDGVVSELQAASAASSSSPPSSSSAALLDAVHAQAELLLNRIRHVVSFRDISGHLPSDYNARFLLPQLPERVHGASRCSGNSSSSSSSQEEQRRGDNSFGGWSRVSPEVADYIETQSNFLPDCPARNTDSTERGAHKQDHSGKASGKRELEQCDIQEFEGLPTAAQFHSVVSAGVPTIFRGAAQNWTLRRVWTRDNFRKRYANATIMIGAIPYGGSYGFDMLNMTVAKFVDWVQHQAQGSAADFASTWWSQNSLAGSSPQAPPHKNDEGDVGDAVPSEAHHYGFGTTFVDNNPLLMHDAGDFFAFMEQNPHVQPSFPQFFLGPAGSGAPLHFHDPAVNALAWGRKRWFLVPPDKTYFSRKPTKTFVQQDVAAAIQRRDQANPAGGQSSARADDGGAESAAPVPEGGTPASPHAPFMRGCVQEAGDLIYVPHRWGHATLNLEASIGIAQEFLYTPLAGWKAALF